MSFSQYIYGPITTEKAINEVEQFGRYSLLVNKKATKPLIKELVETVWNVKVTHISMSVIPKKRGQGRLLCFFRPPRRILYFRP